MNTTMTSTPPAPARAAVDRPGLGWLADRNPFYLLSGLCLLFGCFAISIAIHEEPDQVPPLLTLIGIINIYELLILGLGLYLACRRGLIRDAGVLLVLAIVLMFDVPFLYNELLTASVAAGAPVNGGAFVLAIVKVSLIAWLLGLKLSGRAWLLIALNLALVLALPGVFRALFLAERLDVVSLYGIWWGVGALIALHAIEPIRSSGLSMLQRVLRGTLLSVPLLSVIAHVAAAHFVYEQPVAFPMVAPLLLGLAIYLLHQLPATDPHHAKRRLVILLGGGAIFFSIFTPAALVSEFHWPFTWVGSPMRATLLVAALVWMHNAWWLRDRVVGVLAGVAPLLALLGDSPRAMIDRIAAFSDNLRDWTPSSLMHWGIIAVVTAFVLLCLGAVLSLLRKSDATDN